MAVEDSRMYQKVQAEPKGFLQLYDLLRMAQTMTKTPRLQSVKNATRRKPLKLRSNAMEKLTARSTRSEVKLKTAFMIRWFQAAAHCLGLGVGTA